MQVHRKCNCMHGKSTQEVQNTQTEGASNIGYAACLCCHNACNLSDVNQSVNEATVGRKQNQGCAASMCGNKRNPVV